MTQAVAHILYEVEQLSASERFELRRAIIEKVPMPDDLTDGDFAPLAADMFRSLEDCESVEQTAYLMRSPANVRLLDKAILDLDAGKGRTGQLSILE